MNGKLDKKGKKKKKVEKNFEGRKLEIEKK